ncbi:MAG: transcriptional repressor LexA [Deltaproteobacteria bacterium]
MNQICDLTRRQTEILRFIQGRVTAQGRPPTLREIGRQFGFRSTGTTRGHLKALAAKGRIRLHRNISRSIELTHSAVFRIPVLGRIMAGMPELAYEETEDFLQLDELLPGSDRDVFALRIEGESMTEKGIHAGDIAIIRRQRSAQPGEIVAALIENEATIKVLKKDGAGFYLGAAHPRFKPIRRPFTILGKVTAVLKRF